MYNLVNNANHINPIYMLNKNFIEDTRENKYMYDYQTFICLTFFSLIIHTYRIYITD